MAGKNLKKKEEEVKVTPEVLEEKNNVEEGVTEPYGESILTIPIK